MESAESAEMTTELHLSIDRHLQDFMPPSMKDSDSSSSSLSISDIFSDKSCEEQYENSFAFQYHFFGSRNTSTLVGNPILS